MSMPEIFKDFNRQLSDAKKLAGLKSFFSVDVYQHYSDTCAIRSQQLILRKFGIDLPQEQLMKEAVEHGWYKPGVGTPPVHLGKLLKLHGVDATQYENASLHDIHDMLAQGKSCIVAVDADELCHPDSKWHYLKEKILGIESANHALLVTDVIGDPDNPKLAKVVVTDPGTGQVAKIYSGEEFMDAHKDSNFQLVTTDNPTPEFVEDHGLGSSISFGANDNTMWWEHWAEQHGETLDAPCGIEISSVDVTATGDCDDGDDCETEAVDDEKCENRGEASDEQEEMDDECSDDSSDYLQGY